MKLQRQGRGRAQFLLEMKSLRLREWAIHPRGTKPKAAAPSVLPDP